MKRIGIDIDGVIADSQPVIIGKLNRYFGTNYTINDFVDFNPGKMFGLSREQLDRLIMTWELEIIQEAGPYPGAVEALNHLCPKYEIHLVSARSPQYFQQTAAWLKHHNIPYSRLKLLGQHDKRGACLDLCVDLFIEDSLKNAIQLSSCGIPVLLMDATYNRGRIPDMVTRVYSWEEIIKYIAGSFTGYRRNHS
ncbi:MAG: hypothetical protein K6T66_04890 [Peptococcaceae bacterium]|nr:hypothetical protein [Peptococcaceae bacterium]